jgi:hypothetical protein
VYSVACWLVLLLAALWLEHAVIVSITINIIAIVLIFIKVKLVKIIEEAFGAGIITKYREMPKNQAYPLIGKKGMSS